MKFILICLVICGLLYLLDSPKKTGLRKGITILKQDTERGFTSVTWTQVDTFAADYLTKKEYDSLLK